LKSSTLKVALHYPRHKVARRVQRRAARLGTDGLAHELCELGSILYQIELCFILHDCTGFNGQSQTASAVRVQAMQLSACNSPETRSKVKSASLRDTHSPVPCHEHATATASPGPGRTACGGHHELTSMSTHCSGLQHLTSSSRCNESGCLPNRYGQSMLLTCLTTSSTVTGRMCVFSLSLLHERKCAPTTKAWHLSGPLWPCLLRSM
jgi:hypothetical protein